MRRTNGFTLIELLLVILIIGVLTGITVPSFVRSMQGNRLRSAARTVAAAGRYARSMAVLHQRTVAVDYTLDGSAFVVDLAFARRPVVLDEEEEQGAMDAFGESFVPEVGFRESGQSESDIAGDPAIRIERSLDDVVITRVDVDDVPSRRSGRSGAESGQSVRVIYGSNGRCEPHAITLQDNEGEELVVVVDMLGGTEIRDR